LAMNPLRRDSIQDLRDQFLAVLHNQVKALDIPLNQRVLIVGGSSEDEDVLRRAGFTRMVNSNLESDVGRMKGGNPAHVLQHRTLDVEQMDLPDESFDLVFAHAVLHHCRSPHRALCEMLRVSRRFVVFLEPNDSLAMSLLVRLKFSFPYELPAVIAHDGRSGGVRDSQIPNFIYRWNDTEVRKTASSYMPERATSVHAYPYWDFSVTEDNLSRRRETRIGSITSVVGTRNFISALQFARRFLNWVPVIRRQGNKFFCCLEKSAELRPWLVHGGEGIVFNKELLSGR
jgi:SAM-dependent methyltransferase